MSVSPVDFARVIDKEALVQRQIMSGYRRLKFEEPLESDFRRWRLNLVRHRTRPVGICVIALFLVYSFIDIQVFPPSVYAISVPIRLFLVIPAAVFLIWSSYQSWAQRYFLWAYLVAYLLSAWGMCFMIFAAHQQSYWMPYDGLLLLLMGGYFLLAMPFWYMVLASWTVLPVYIGLELMTDFPLETLQYNVVFLLTANLIGTVGVYLIEYNQRTLFLNRSLLELGMQKAELDSLAKSRFISTARHDLRQPLLAINLMLEHLEHQLPLEQQSILQKVQKATVEMEQLLTETLDEQRFSFGAFRPENSLVNLSDMIRSLVDELSDIAAERQVAVRYSRMSTDNVMVWTDKLILKRVLRNLVVNAIEHSGGTEVTLVLERSDDHWLISVVDDGDGWEDESLPKGEAPAKAKSGDEDGHLSRQVIRLSGSGMGLEIVRLLVGVLGGDVIVRNRPDAGAEVVVRLPRAQVRS